MSQTILCGAISKLVYDSLYTSLSNIDSQIFDLVRSSYDIKAIFIPYFAHTTT